MQAEELKSLLLSDFPDADIEIQIDGSHFFIEMTSKAFEGLRPVQQQQLVYATINHRIADQSMHAVHLKLHTPA